MPPTRPLHLAFMCAALGLIVGMPGLAAPDPQQPAAAEPSWTVDMDDLVAEIQQPVRGRENAGLVWWIPVEFWENSGMSSDQVRPLREYTMVAVFAGTIGPLGGLDFVPASEIRSHTFLRDANGVDYSPLDTVSPDASTLVMVLRPLFANVLGQVGENLEVLFFPARDKDGNPLIEPQGRGRFSIVLQDLPNPGEHVYQWRLPLSALLPPKYCPVGQERVMANWNYCPWHGVGLAPAP